MATAEAAILNYLHSRLTGDKKLRELMERHYPETDDDEQILFPTVAQDDAVYPYAVHSFASSPVAAWDAVEEGQYIIRVFDYSETYERADNILARILALLNGHIFNTSAEEVKGARVYKQTTSLAMNTAKNQWEKEATFNIRYAKCQEVADAQTEGGLS